MTVSDMALRPVGVERMHALIAGFAGLPIAIVGDVILDQFIFGRVNRISPEAPVPVVEFDHEEFRPGGAANVALNVGMLGGTAQLVGLIGRDQAAIRLTDMLHRHSVGTAGLVQDPARPTTTKVRLVTTRNQQVARIDYESGQEAEGRTEADLVAGLERAASSARAIIISDYLKGVVTRTLVRRARDLARDLGVPLLVDPKVPHLDYYEGATLVTPNNQEAEVATHTRITTNDDARAAARSIRARIRCAGVLITRGESGMWLSEDETEGHLPAAAREVADVTGAGDTVIATLALALAAGAEATEAATLANSAAGVTVASSVRRR